jgi:hypothetical protein
MLAFLDARLIRHAGRAKCGVIEPSSHVLHDDRVAAEHGVERIENPRRDVDPVRSAIGSAVHEDRVPSVLGRPISIGRESDTVPHRDHRLGPVELLLDLRLGGGAAGEPDRGEQDEPPGCGTGHPRHGSTSGSGAAE